MSSCRSTSATSAPPWRSTRGCSGAPAKLRPGYANFALDDPPLKLVLNSPGNGPGGTINQLGVEVGSAEEVAQAGTGWRPRAWTPSPNRARSAAMRGRTRCGHTTRMGVAWEYYTVLEHIETP